MDKILNAASDIMAATNVELSLKGKAKEKVIKILKELVEEKFKSTNKQNAPCQNCSISKECRKELTCSLYVPKIS